MPGQLVQLEPLRWSDAKLMGLVGAGLDVGLQAVGELGLLERGIAREGVQGRADAVVEELPLLVGDLVYGCCTV